MLPPGQLKGPRIAQVVLTMVLYDRTTYLLIEGILNRSGRCQSPKSTNSRKHNRFDQMQSSVDFSILDELSIAIIVQFPDLRQRNQSAPDLI
jgi:hypothetical protein